jgi:hypothetical protein
MSQEALGLVEVEHNPKRNHFAVGSRERRQRTFELRRQADLWCVNLTPRFGHGLLTPDPALLGTEMIERGAAGDETQPSARRGATRIKPPPSAKRPLERLPGQILGEPSWLTMAERTFAFIARAMTRGDRLGHSWREGRLLFPGLASDFANMIRAALALHEATAERGYLDQALAWQGALDRHYANPDTGGYFLTADDAEGLVVRPGATSDDATPNPNGIAAQNLIRLAAFTGDHAWREQADRLIEGVLGAAGWHHRLPPDGTGRMETRCTGGRAWRTCPRAGAGPW